LKIENLRKDSNQDETKEK